ncbi:unnamed protein product [Vitrella brassicaformis CCMP3155]|uniref:Uncharacterized protein n=1 Tax=Vitrella brassicaformis (strain CCMP3155) TaxID=1169540 RepID=A0A0G4ET62_VITBC|nr:unnamed protein product [Vitrella brassicaformis CCMP3155]|eukprot:CEM01479.1 unnamed protein product [Vitrella brassicaformis CCMP3155]
MKTAASVLLIISACSAAAGAMTGALDVTEPLAAGLEDERPKCRVMFEASDASSEKDGAHVYQMVGFRWSITKGVSCDAQEETCVISTVTMSHGTTRPALNNEPSRPGDLFSRSWLMDEYVETAPKDVTGKGHCYKNAVTPVVCKTQTKRTFKWMLQDGGKYCMDPDTKVEVKTAGLTRPRTSDTPLFAQYGEHKHVVYFPGHKNWMPPSNE